MDFFEAQDEARKKTKWLILWFILAVIGVVVAVDLLVIALVDEGPNQIYIVITASVLTGGIMLAASCLLYTSPSPRDS